MFATAATSLDSQEKLLRGQIREAKAEAKALSDQVTAEERGFKCRRDELAANKELANKGFMSKTRMLGLERAVADYESRRGEHQGTLAQSRQRAGDFELRIVSLQNEYMQQARTSSRKRPPVSMTFANGCGRAWMRPCARKSSRPWTERSSTLG